MVFVWKRQWDRAWYGEVESELIEWNRQPFADRLDARFLELELGRKDEAVLDRLATIPLS